MENQLSQLKLCKNDLPPRHRDTESFEMSGKWLIFICLIFTCLCNCVSTKKETKTGLGSNPKDWSNSQGKMKWDDAKVKCKNIGMRLPTWDELFIAHNNNFTEQRNKEYFLSEIFFWTSEEVYDGSAIVFTLGRHDYHREPFNKNDNRLSVRCIRESSR